MQEVFLHPFTKRVLVKHSEGNLVSPEEERRQQLGRDIFPYVRHFYDGWLDASAREPFYRPSARY